MLNASGRWADNVDEFGLHISKLRENVYVLTLTGNVDIHTAPMFRHALLGLAEKQESRVALDLMNVEFMDSTSLGIVLVAARKLEESKRALVVAVGPNVDRLFSVTGFTPLIRPFHTREEALSRLLDTSQVREESS